METDPSPTRVEKEEFRSAEVSAVWREGDVQSESLKKASLVEVA